MHYNNNHRHLHVLLLIIISGFIVNCTPKGQDTNTDENLNPIYYSDEFKSFLAQFENDSLFQLSHIVFPLEGQQPLSEDYTSYDTQFKWQQEDWVMHKSFDDVNGTYTREWIDLNGIVIEIISDNSGQYSMERRFGKLSSGWHLIYYRAMGNYPQNKKEH